ncbi:molybdenum cofactor carrier [Pseudomonas aeruginosa]|uniref:putative molybdenum carrier protein n=1 Tax=Pseudomonas aeruginosa TaxID=287 RepID=UPI000E30DA6A|nr:putative molybdenum carrier protein [Pseudomonas aeruginosa]MBT9310517.1 putative molybdenum carrier protein [Pseudomonas aeruginosa]RFJ37767.1 molybdenum cofactor carrier [Pseudomonas aeruginosa]RFL52542.1 molybdenum cofactor carrier [Pseudomonas aeruginosa]HBO3652188.1 putative molybdenum carrier protein [Pseudomonas aeruginosa]HBO5451863.1 molybdenum cofactor carrier [Pseudomonas aeruginosa]
MNIQRIISGGQTGVDRAALDFAIARQIPHGGCCPAGRRAADGVLDARYQLVETESSGYRQRTTHNVLDADATLIICRGRLEGGSLLTRDLATGHGKPLLLCDLHAPTEELLAAWQDWLVSHPIAILNIAGPSEARNPGIYLQASALLELFWSTEYEPI